MLIFFLSLLVWGGGCYRLTERGIIVPACGSAGVVGHLGEAGPSRCELQSDCLQINVAFSAGASRSSPVLETSGGQTTGHEGHRGTHRDRMGHLGAPECDCGPSGTA